MPGRIPRALGSGLLLFGAFAIGSVIHEVAVEGSVGPLSPYAVVGVLLGGLLIAAGLRLERTFDPSEYVPEDEEDDEEEFDEDLSPISGEMMEGREADEEYESG